MAFDRAIQADHNLTGYDTQPMVRFFLLGPLVGESVDESANGDADTHERRPLANDTEYGKINRIFHDSVAAYVDIQEAQR